MTLLAQVDWQNLLVLAIVASAVIHLARRIARKLLRQKTSGCGQACSGCPSSQPEKRIAVPIITVDQLLSGRQRHLPH